MSTSTSTRISRIIAKKERITKNMKIIKQKAPEFVEKSIQKILQDVTDEDAIQKYQQYANKTIRQNVNKDIWIMDDSLRKLDVLELNVQTVNEKVEEDFNILEEHVSNLKDFLTFKE